MSLMDDIRAEESGSFETKVGKGVVAGNKANEGTKKSAYEWQKKRNQALYEAACRLVALIPADKKNDEQTKADIALVTRVPGSGGGGTTFGKPVIYQIFGDKPTVGMTMSSLDVFKKSKRGVEEVKKYCKKWLGKVADIEYDEPSDSFKIKAIHALPQNVE